MIWTYSVSKSKYIFTPETKRKSPTELPRQPVKSLLVLRSDPVLIRKLRAAAAFCDISP